MMTKFSQCLLEPGHMIFSTFVLPFDDATDIALAE